MYSVQGFTVNNSSSGCAHKACKKRTGRAHHTDLIYSHKPKAGLARALRLEAKYATDQDLKEYSFKRKVLDPIDPPSPWYDENYRKVEGNWKSQYKVNKQYNIHTHQKSSETIRKMTVEEFSLNEIDNLLEEEFIHLL